MLCDNCGCETNGRHKFMGYGMVWCIGCVGAPAAPALAQAKADLKTADDEISRIQHQLSVAQTSRNKIHSQVCRLEPIPKRTRGRARVP